jgi:Peptidase family C25
VSNHAWARMPLFASLAVISFILIGSLDVDHASLWAQARRLPPGTAYVARGLSAEQLVVLGATVTAGDTPGLLLVDGPSASRGNRALLDALKPPRVVRVGHTEQTADATSSRVPGALWPALFPQAPTVVVAPARPRRLLLQAACLAGALRAPLVISHSLASETRDLNRRLVLWKTGEVIAVGKVYPRSKHLKGVTVTRLSTEAKVTSAYLDRIARDGPVHTLVVANPADSRTAPGLSCLAPWMAVRKRAALLLTDEKGADVERLVHNAVRTRRLRRADTLLIVANLETIPMRERPNPIATDKDTRIDMEPLTPTGTEPFSFSVGRVFHEDLGVAALMITRQQLLARKTGTPRVLVASNPGRSLPLLETFSRSTVRELRNCNYDTTALYGTQVTQSALQKGLPKHDLFLWEGHHNTLVNDWKFATWEEPLPPSMVFLQSCLALMEHKVHPVLARGAVGVIGTTTRTYSASGGACSLGFYNALLYDNLTVGASLRQSKNFLLAYILLKEKRLGKDARKSGANLRAAWAFTLWGDPTLRLPTPEKATPKLPPIRHQVRGNTITVALPPDKHDRVLTDRFQAAPYPNGRLAGLIRKGGGDDGRPLVPLVFAEVHLPKAPAGMVPQLHSRLPGRNWVFNWDARRRCGYLLAIPRAKDRDELRFHVYWTDPNNAEQSAGGAD